MQGTVWHLLGGVRPAPGRRTSWPGSRALRAAAAGGFAGAIACAGATTRVLGAAHGRAARHVPDPASRRWAPARLAARRPAAPTPIDPGVGAVAGLSVGSGDVSTPVFPAVGAVTPPPRPPAPPGRCRDAVTLARLPQPDDVAQGFVDFLSTVFVPACALLQPAAGCTLPARPAGAPVAGVPDQRR